MPYIIDDKIQFLLRAGKLLSTTLDYNVTLVSVGKIIVESVADFCLIDIMEEGKMTRVVARVADKKQQLLVNKMFDFPPDPRNKRAIYEAAESGRPILIKEATKSWLRTVSKIEEERELVNQLGLHSFIFAPLKSRGKVIGVITIGSKKGGHVYTEDDVLFIESLAGRAGLAVDNARLFSEAQVAIQEREQFLSIASHELKTPLTSILLGLQLALRKLRTSQLDVNDMEQTLEKSIAQTRRMSRLINDLLNISLISSGRLVLEREEFDIVTLVNDVVSRFELQLKNKKTKVKVNAQSRRITGTWDRVRLEQVVTNLLSNALKYGKGKPITITISNAKDVVSIAFADKGIGIKEDDQREIFDAFKRAVESKDYRGIGVGLYICKQIVLAHGGDISVSSTPGKGATFTVKLPCEAPSDTQVQLV